MLELDFIESEFLAMWIDATVKELSEMKRRPVDYLTTQSFLGKEIPEEADFLEHIEDNVKELKRIRAKIREAFSI